VSLDVHLYGERIGTLFPAGEADYRFAYSSEAVTRAGAGSILLSNSLPVRTEPFSAAASQAYADALLPEGAWRRRLARELGVDAADGYRLLCELGRDCAGAVVFVPEGTEFARSSSGVAWLSDGEFEELVWQPPKRLLDSSSEQRMRFSLSGAHHKLALVREEASGRWAWPAPTMPSTHIVKPETGAYPDLVANEMFCTEVARRAGLPAIEASVEEIAGRPCLVSRRFDRSGEGLAATRIHQEDFCQALGFAVDGRDSPGFAESWGLLQAVDRPADVALLLTAAVCNYVLGNGNAHGKNFALLFDHDGPRLAPLYDLVSTVVYDAPIHIGMVLADDYESEHAYLLELAQVSEECHFDFDAFRELTGRTAARVADCLPEVREQARAQGWHAPVIDEIADLAAERAFGLGVEVDY
jgi:serine/threonine-protein kinase HipA